MKTFFKLRHKKTGLFYKPSVYGSKTNLSKEGKTYSKKPSFKYHKYIYTTESVKENRCNPKSVETKIDDWEVVTFKTIEVDVESLRD